MKLGIGLFTAVCSVVFLHCSSLPDICRGAECGVSPDSSSLDGGGDSLADGDTLAECDPAVDGAKCVTNEAGIFVDSNANNDNPGTRELPVKTIATAITKLGTKRRIYVCEGTYAERVQVKSGIWLAGGFGCSSWAYTAGLGVKVAPGEQGYALHIEKVSDAVRVTDMEFVAQEGRAPGESSIGIFVSESLDVKLRRVRVVAGKGAPGGDASDPPSNLSTDPPNGTDGGNGPAAPTPCRCKFGGASSTGGGGGAKRDAAKVPPVLPGRGQDGVAVPPPATLSSSGKGGAGSSNSPDRLNDVACQGGLPGSDGSPGKVAPGATRPGSLGSAGWEGTSGAVGQAGTPGVGGGGGGGNDDKFGAGGGCGGCGGNGGLGGMAGGSSISIASYASTLSVESSELNTGAGANGGKGSRGEGGGGGGGGLGTCGGARGGNGGGGGGAGGGAGGVSVGLLFVKGTVTSDASTEAHTAVQGFGVGGPGGLGGPGGSQGGVVTRAPDGLPGNPGKDGVSKAILDLSQ